MLPNVAWNEDVPGVGSGMFGKFAEVSGRVWGEMGLCWLSMYESLQKIEDTCLFVSSGHLSIYKVRICNMKCR